MPFFSLAILISASLVFLVQPLMGRYLLPWYGGTPNVWAVVLLFFQVGLLVGYLYAHALSEIRSRTLQVCIHIAFLLVAAVVTTPIIPSPGLVPQEMLHSEVWILINLGITVGLPYVFLSATGPLLQSWYYGWRQTGQPWFLYAISNVGSLAGLLAFPLLLEPLMTREAISVFWSVAFMVFIVSASYCGWLFLRSRPIDSPTADIESVTGDGPLGKVDHLHQERSPSWGQYAQWIGLAMLPVVLLMTITTRMTTDVAVVSLFWVLPLAVYLLSLIIAFSGDRFYWAMGGRFALPLVMVLMLIPWQYNTDRNVGAMLTIVCLTLFMSSLILHGELFLRRPHPRFLTRFYLATSFGGALGGFVVTMIAPHVFPLYLEFEVAIIATCLVVIGLLGLRPWASWRFWLPASLGLVAAVVLAWKAYDQHSNRMAHVVDHDRSFFGVVRIESVDGPEGTTLMRMLHGNILHGFEALGIDIDRREGFAYYGRNSGLGQSWPLDVDRTLRVGVLGTGSGTLAGWAQKGDIFDFYEIDPLVVAMAENHFTYLSSARERGSFIHHIIGDGRLRLEATDHQYDVLVMDAFTSNAVPVHLLTREAMISYMDRVRKDGILAVNISNRYVDLRGVLWRHAMDQGWAIRLIMDDGKGNPFWTPSMWAIIAHNEDRLSHIEGIDSTPPRSTPLWTDSFSNILHVIR